MFYVIMLSFLIRYDPIPHTLKKKKITVYVYLKIVYFGNKETCCIYCTLEAEQTAVVVLLLSSETLFSPCWPLVSRLKEIVFVVLLFLSIRG